VTASFRTPCLAPVSVHWARLQVQEAPVSTFPRTKLRGAQWTKSTALVI